MLKSHFALALSFAGTLLVTGLPLHAADIIIESRIGGQNNDGYKEMSGKWLDSNNPPDTSKSSAPGLTPQGQIGSRKTAASFDTAGGDKNTVLSAARFTPKIETAGDYHVYVTFSKAGNATPVTYVIKDSAGEKKVDIVQYGWGAASVSNANQWVDLGVFKFTPGADQYVEMQVTGATGSVDTTNNPQAFADAVRFSTEPVAEAVPAGTAPAPQVTTFGKPLAGAPAQAPAAQPDTGEIAWVGSLATGRSEATTQNRKLFVFFYSPQSARSTDYEKNVINDPRVKGVLKGGFVSVKVNMDTDRELASQLQVYRAGTVNVYDAATGNGLEHISDTPDVDELIKRLNAVK